MAQKGKANTRKSITVEAVGGRFDIHAMMIPLGVFVLAIAVRIPVMNQSLWYDELYTLNQFVRQPWETVIAGEYSRNNHVLFTILAKVLAQDATRGDESAWLARLPSLLAGAMAAGAMAWSLRKQHPLLSTGAGVVMALHPWLVSFSGWARGYALAILLVVLATQSLPKRPRWVDWIYGSLLAAAIYTQPLAGLVVFGHVVAVAVFRRKELGTVARSAGVGIVAAGLLYAAMFKAGSVVSQGEKPSISYSTFIVQSLAHGVEGIRDTAPPRGALICLALIGVGAAASLRGKFLREEFVSYAVASALGLALPLAVPVMGETRAMFWLIPLVCISFVAILKWCMEQRRAAAMGLFALMVIYQGISLWKVLTVPTQPIREVAALAKEKGGAIGVYMGSVEARIEYSGIEAMAYQLRPSAGNGGMPALLDVEKKRPDLRLAVVFYEELLTRDQPELWKYLNEHYRVIKRLKGRTADGVVFERLAK